jgi:hypothetical protein
MEAGKRLARLHICVKFGESELPTFWGLCTMLETKVM